MKYDYLEAMKEDIKELLKYDYSEIDENAFLYGLDDLQERLYDDFFVNDSITGNASGSYFCNSYRAKECVFDNTDLCMEALQEFCTPAKEIGERFLNEDWEYLDVTIRCYLLSYALSEALQELKKEIENDIEGNL